MCVLLLPPIKSFVYQGSIVFVPKFAEVIKTPPANAGDMGSIPGSGRSLGVGNGNPLQYSCLGNPMDREEPGRLQSMEVQNSGM